MAETQYSIEYAKSGRAGCKGPKAACEAMFPDRKIEKGALRLGRSYEDSRSGHMMCNWTHWACVSSKVLANIGSTDDLAGFDTLNAEDQEKVRKAIETGENPDQAVAPAKPKKTPAKVGTSTEGETGEEVAKSERKGRGKKAAATDDADQTENPTPKKRGRPKKKTEEEEGLDEEAKPKKKGKKVASKKKTKAESDEEVADE